jgi:hypothetical protein
MVFVEIKIKIVKVNIMGTQRLRAPTAIDTDETDLTESGIATGYWKREVDDGKKAAIDLHRRHPNVARDPSRESLYVKVKGFPWSPRSTRRPTWSRLSPTSM